MQRLFLSLVFLAFIPAYTSVQEELPVIASPQAGQVLQGVVMVTGTSILDGFVSAEIAFSYTSNPTDTWFVIATGDQPMTDGMLATWDTTTITDGTYTLRLRIILDDGSHLDALVPDLRVRNYTPVETATPTQTPVSAPQASPIPMATSTPLPFPTPTLLPLNPIEFERKDLFISLGYGALAVLVSSLLFGLYVRIRRR